MAEFFDISKWDEKRQFQTGGTRSKCVVEHPDTSDLYFFKTSMLKEKKDYKHEFWSEIIASEVGRALGFNMLVYDIAYKNGEIGCLSKLMIDPNTESLYEGVNYLQGFDPTYIPENKESYDSYTFQFICNALTEYSLESRIPFLIKTIIFDSLIGNSDRHQENWGFILYSGFKDKKGIKILNKFMSSPFYRGIVKSFFILFKIKDISSLRKKILLINKAMEDVKGRYSPIYDSGSCLGRELEDEKIDKMLSDNNMLNAYIKKGPSEIRWNGPKINHFDLIRNIMNSKNEYHNVVKSTISNINRVFNDQKIRNIVLEIDKKLPQNLIQNKLPDNRKELIIKMVTLRFEKLKEVLK